MLLSLFLSAFIAATLLPISSEAVLLLALQQEHAIWLLWLIATTGNSLGAMTSWFIGRYLFHYRHHKRFPIARKRLRKLIHWFRRFGGGLLLLSWLPIIGDGFALVAGLSRYPWWLTACLVFIGKGLRYAAVIYLAGLAG